MHLKICKISAFSSEPCESKANDPLIPRPIDPIDPIGPMFHCSYFLEIFCRTPDWPYDPLVPRTTHWFYEIIHRGQNYSRSVDATTQ